MSLSSDILTRTTPAAIKRQGWGILGGALLATAKMMHNIRAKDDISKSQALTYLGTKGPKFKEVSDGPSDKIDNLFHPKWNFNSPTSYQYLFTSEKCRATPNAWIDIRCEWLLLMMNQLLKYTVNNSSGEWRFNVPLGNNRKPIKPTGFRLSFIILLDLALSTALRAIAFALKVLVGAVMAVAGLIRLGVNFPAIITALYKKEPMPDGAKKALGWFVPLADAIFKPMLRFGEKYPKTTIFLGIVAILFAVALSGGFGAPVAVALTSFMFSGFGLGNASSAIVAGITKAFATNWLGVAVTNGAVLSGFVAAGIGATIMELAGRAVRKLVDYTAKKKEAHVAQRKAANEALVIAHGELAEKRVNEYRIKEQNFQENKKNIEDPGAGIGSTDNLPPSQEHSTSTDDALSNSSILSAGAHRGTFAVVMNTLTDGTADEVELLVDTAKKLNAIADGDPANPIQLRRDRSVTSCLNHLAAITEEAERLQQEYSAPNDKNELLPDGYAHDLPGIEMKEYLKQSGDHPPTPQWKGKGKAKQPVDEEPSSPYLADLYQAQREALEQKLASHVTFGSPGGASNGQGSSNGNTQRELIKMLEKEGEENDENTSNGNKKIDGPF